MANIYTRTLVETTVAMSLITKLAGVLANHIHFFRQVSIEGQFQMDLMTKKFSEDRVCASEIPSWYFYTVRGLSDHHTVKFDRSGGWFTIYREVVLR